MLHLLITIGKGDLYIFWNKSFLGFSPFSKCELTWGQMVIYRLMPFLILTIGFYIVSILIGGTFGSFFKWVAVMDMGISGFDLLFTPFMFRLPKNAVFYSGGLWQVRE